MRSANFILVSLLTLASIITLAACGNQQPSNIPELYILSPHGADTRREFETAFSNWHQKKYGTPVKIQWPDVGGAGTMMKALQAQFDSQGHSDYDLVFGGGSAVFDDLAKRGFIAPPDLPADVINAVPASIHGVRLRAANNVWFGATLSYFGIVVNKDRLRELGLPRPRTWIDLTGPGWTDELSLADPSKSRSVATCFEMILQQSEQEAIAKLASAATQSASPATGPAFDQARVQAREAGWRQGWSVLVRLFANAGAVKEGGAWPSEETGMGNAAAGIVIDFYGRMAMAKYGQNIAQFIVPDGGSALDADPIAMLKGAPNQQLASHMIEFVLSPDGQRLWTLRPGTPGGPQRTALGRLSVRPELYENEAQYMTDPASPFQANPPLRIDARTERIRSTIMGDLVKSALVDTHSDLVSARRAVKARGDDPKLIAMFDLPPFAAAEMQSISEKWLQPDHTAAQLYQSQMKVKWRSMYEARWAEIKQAAQ